MRAFLLFLLPLCAAAQLQLFIAPPGGEERPVSANCDLGSGYVGDVASTRFRLRNVGTQTITLNELRTTGAGFSSTGAPSLPHLVAPATNVDFTVHFRPAEARVYPGTLQINTLSIPITATGIGSATLLYGGLQLSTGATVDFGRIERGTQKTLELELRNTTSMPLEVPPLSVTPGAFTLAPQPGAQSIAPGEALVIPVRFAPTASQIFTAQLKIGADRAVTLTGTAFEPQMPRPVLELSNAVLRSGEQGRITVRLSAVSRTNTKGQVRMQLRPIAGAQDNDSAAQFLAGSRTVAFDVTEGTDEVKFSGSGSTSLTFQAGTTAGTLMFIVEAGGFAEQTTLTIDPEPVRIDRATATRNGSNIEVQVSGFDNTRTANDLIFTFYNASGQPLPAITTRAASDFAKWWENSNLGGVFSLRAVFPVTGDISQIKAVEVQLANSSGTGKTDKLAF